MHQRREPKWACMQLCLAPSSRFHLEDQPALLVLVFVCAGQSKTMKGTRTGSKGTKGGIRVSFGGGLAKGGAKQVCRGSLRVEVNLSKRACEASERV